MAVAARTQPIGQRLLQYGVPRRRRHRTPRIISET
jgi:hypothetical protein